MKSGSDRWQKIAQLFHGALERQPSERAAYLKEACTHDESLRLEVESLLVAVQDAASFLSKPVIEVSAKAMKPESQTFIGLGWYLIESARRS